MQHYPYIIITQTEAEYAEKILTYQKADYEAKKMEKQSSQGHHVRTSEECLLAGTDRLENKRRSITSERSSTQI